MKKIIRVQKNGNERLDKFLKKEVFFDSTTTRGEIIRHIKSGDILVNEKKAKPSQLLKENDILKIDLPKNPTEISPNPKVKFTVLFENENFAVIDKPSGVQVHPSKKNEKDTLASGLLQKFPEIANVGDEPETRPGIVHRLDRDTSGILIIARNQKTFEAFKEKFQKHEMKKTYWALAHGNFSSNSRSGTIEKPLARSGNYKKQTVAGGKTKTKVRPAVTDYNAIKEIGYYSLLEVMPKTGRMHQIRIHLFSIGHPIVGDKLYKIKGTSSGATAKRQLLHAKKIDFELDSKKFTFEAPLPQDFQDFLSSHD
jgi:23S rRNA pseudouridine1911/1915/1917 synthase